MRSKHFRTLIRWAVCLAAPVRLAALGCSAHESDTHHATARCSLPSGPAAIRELTAPGIQAAPPQSGAQDSSTAGAKTAVQRAADSTRRRTGQRGPNPSAVLSPAEQMRARTASQHDSASPQGRANSAPNLPARAAPRPTNSASPAELMRARSGATAAPAMSPADRMRAQSGVAAPSAAPGRGVTYVNAPATLAEVAPPVGWTRTAASDGSIRFTTLPSDTNVANIYIAAPQPLNGSSVADALHAWLRARFAAQLDLSQMSKPKVGRTARGNLAAWADETPDFPDSRDGMRLVAIAIARRDNTFLPVLMLTKDEADQYARAEQFADWFHSVVLPGDSGPLWTPLSPTAPGPLQGLWFGTALRNQFNIYGGMDLIAQRNYLVFSRTGFVYRELPDGGGVDNLNPASLCAKDRRDCGTYRVDANRVFFRWYSRFGLIETDSADIDAPRKEPVSFSYDGMPMGRVKPAIVTRLDGEFTSIDGTSSGPNGSISTSRSITFRTDGTYEATRFVGFTSTPGALTGSESGSVVGYNNSGPNRGTYQIQGYTLIMRPESGPVRYSTIIFFDDQSPVTAVLIDDDYYRK
jgi:hypothetical protein